MDFNRLSAPSLKELFVREIEKRILSGDLSIGDHLPPERELSQKMGVSRTVVNSGLVELAGKGFIEVKPRIGAFVADYKRKGTIDTLMAILRYNGGMLSKRESKSLLETRLAIESLALELAVPRLTVESLDALGTILSEFIDAKTIETSAEEIFRFHHEICILSENSILPVIFYSFKDLSTLLWRKYFQIHGKTALLQSTKRLYSCLLKRDRRGALDAFQSSLNKTIEGDVSIY